MKSYHELLTLFVLVFCTTSSGCEPGQALGPTFTPLPTLTSIPTPTNTPIPPTETPEPTSIPLPEWEQKLPAGTTVEKNIDGTFIVTEISWLKELGMDTKQYDTVFNSQSLTIKAFKPGSDQKDPESLLLEADYDKDKKEWNQKYEVHLAISMANKNCQATKEIRCIR
jgi:hypothetical protein